MVQVHCSNVFHDERQSWLQQMAEGPIHIVQPYAGYKVHGIRFHTRARSMNKKTSSCGVLVKGTSDGSGSGVDYYGVLEEVIQLEYLGEPRKRCLLFRCEWYDPSNPRGTRYSKLNCTYEINIQRKYAKYDPFIIGDVAYQVFYIPYPRDIPHKANWFAALLNKPRQCPNMQGDAVNPNTVFQEDVMASTSQLSETLPQFLADVAGVMEEVEVVDVAASEGEQPDDMDDFEQQEWDDAETDTETDEEGRQYKSDDDEEDDEDDQAHIDNEQDLDEDDEC